MSCPFAAGAAAGAAASAPAAPAPTTCPFSGASSQQQQPAQPAPTCPLGFGTARGPKLSTLHCPVCRGLLFDAHSVSSCRHTFCRSCIAQTQDCPSCGRDVDGLEPNAELAGLVDTFLDTHSKSPDLVAAQADLGPLPDNSAASFFMAQGLKSLAGGNLHAALHRLGKAKQAMQGDAAAATTLAAAGAAAAAVADPQDTVMSDAAAAAAQQAAKPTSPRQQQQQQRGAAGTDAVSRAVQLATICGCLGDCYQRLGEGDQAERLYKESVAAVQPHSEDSAEAAHAMSVSLNKLGDAQYLAQQLPAARALYRQALQLRQLCCGPLTAGQAGPQAQLELAASLVKMADICKALGEAAEADQHMRRAHGVCCEVQALEAPGSPLPPQAASKLQLLLGVLQSHGQHMVGAEAAQAAGPEADAADS